MGTGSLNYLRTPGTFSNDITITKQFFIGEKRSLEFRTSIFNVFNSARFQTLNLNALYKSNGSTFASGSTLINSPEALQKAVLTSNPNASTTTQFNQYRTGVGSTNLTSVLDPRRVELALRFKF